MFWLYVIVVCTSYMFQLYVLVYVLDESTSICLGTTYIY